MTDSKFLLTYRYGTTHVNSLGNVARVSQDGGLTWGAETIYNVTAPYDVYVRRTPLNNLLSTFDGVGGQHQYNRSNDCAITWSSPQLFSPDPNGFFVTIGFTYQGVGYMVDYEVSGDVHLWQTNDDGYTWSRISNIRQSGDPAISETGICRMPDGRLLAISRNPTATYAHFSSDMGVTWGASQDYTSQLGVIDLPQLVVLRGVVVLIGRDHTKKQLVMFSSLDNGATFQDRAVIDYWTGLPTEGGYSWPQVLDDSRIFIAYYCDSRGTVHPDIKSAVVKVLAGA